MAGQDPARHGGPGAAWFSGHLLGSGQSLALHPTVRSPPRMVPPWEGMLIHTLTQGAHPTPSQHRDPASPSTSTHLFSPSCYFCSCSGRSRASSPLWQSWCWLDAGSLGSAGRWPGLQPACGGAWPCLAGRLSPAASRDGVPGARRHLPCSQQVPAVRVKEQILRAHKQRCNSLYA